MKGARRWIFFFYLFLEKHICIIPATSQCVASPCLESEGLVYSNFQSQFFFHSCLMLNSVLLCVYSLLVCFRCFNSWQECRQISLVPRLFNYKTLLLKNMKNVVCHCLAETSKYFPDNDTLCISAYDSSNLVDIIQNYRGLHRCTNYPWHVPHHVQVCESFHKTFCIPVKN